MNEVHVCRILMRIVIWSDGKCTEDCAEADCPVKDPIDSFDNVNFLRFFPLEPPVFHRRPHSSVS